MKKFACGDVVPGCSATWVLEDDEAIFAAVGRHAAEDHGITEITDELVQAVRDHIRIAA
jgi:predicted small metal-binding protein